MKLATSFSLKNIILLRSVDQLRLKCPKLTLWSRFSLPCIQSLTKLRMTTAKDFGNNFLQFSSTCSVWALTVAPLYCLVAVRCGKGAATDPELASWAEVKPRGPEGRVGFRVNPEMREASTSSREEVEVVRNMLVHWPAGGKVANCFQRGGEGELSSRRRRHSLSTIPSHSPLYFSSYLTLLYIFPSHLTLSVYFSSHPLYIFHPISLSCIHFIPSHPLANFSSNLNC